MTIIIHTIPVQALPEVQKEIASLTRRAVKLKCQIPTIWIGSQREETHTVNRKEVVFVVVDVEVTSEPIVCEGYTFLAKLDQTEGGCIVSSALGTEIALPASELKRYAEGPRSCDHCNLSRGRLSTFLLTHEVKRIVQFGRNCLRDTFGRDPGSLLAAFDLSAAIDALLRGAAQKGEEGGYEGQGTGRSAEYLGHVAEIVLASGFVSKKSSTDDKPATCTEAMWRWMSREPIYEVRDEAKKLVDLSLEWARGLTDEEVEAGSNAEPPNLYLYNLRIASRLYAFDRRFSGLLASVIAAYQRTEAIKLRAEQAQSKAPSGYVGTEGERQVFPDLIVSKVIEVDGFATYHNRNPVAFLHIMRDLAGNSLVWKSSATKLEEGTTVSLYGTVKRHTDYRGERQTNLTRCDIVTKKQFVCQVKGSVIGEVEAYDEKEAKQLFLVKLGLEKLPRGAKVVFFVPPPSDI